MKKAVLFTALVLGLCGLFSAISAQITPVTTQSLSKMPLAFTKNIGQWDEQVLYRTSSGGATIWICRDKVVYQFLRTVKDSSKTGALGGFPNVPIDRFSNEKDSVEQLVITAKFIGANPNLEVIGEEIMEYRCNYFIGNDPTKWYTDVPNCESVILQGVYEGVCLRLFAGDNGQLAYQYEIEGSASPEQVRVEYDGIGQASVSGDGKLVCQTKWGDIAGLVAIPKVVIESTETTTGETPGHIEETNSPVRITQEVELVYSTYLGGGDFDIANGISVDRGGHAYVVGRTNSYDFPLQNPYQFSTGNGSIFVSKLDPSGGGLVYSTVIGGNSNDEGYSVALDSSLNMYVTGFTGSQDFPLVNPIQLSIGSSNSVDAFVLKLSQTGNTLLYSTYLGGGRSDVAYAIEIDPWDCAYITGQTISDDYPTHNPFQLNPDGPFDPSIPSFAYSDAFVSKLNKFGNALIYSTYLGGTDSDISYDLSIDSAGSAYITGETYSINFPVKNAYQTSNAGSRGSGFVAKLGPNGDSLVFSTYLGSTDYDRCNGIALGADGTVFVTGQTNGANFPTQAPIQLNQPGPDCFLTRMNQIGNALIFSTYIGGSSYEYGISVSVVNGNAIVSGYTYSSDFPLVNSLQTYLGENDVFVLMINSLTMELQTSTLLGGANVDLTHGMTASSDGSVYVTGETWSQGFPLLSPFQYDQGGIDAFVSKLYLGGDSNCNSGIDSDQDGIDDQCDTCINVRPVVNISPADMAVRMKSAYYYYPTITDSDGGPFDITYLKWPHWCTIRNDSVVVGVAPDTAFVEPIEFELVDGCNIDTISFDVSVYLCGNANGDTVISITDPVFIINFIFAGGPAPQPYLQGDPDCNGRVDITDAVYLINYIFASGRIPCYSCK